MGDLEDGDLVTDAVVLGKVVSGTGEVKVLIGSSTWR
jgi:hypothetical protein